MGPMIRVQPRERTKPNAASNRSRAASLSSMHSNQPQYPAFSLCVCSQMLSWIPAIRPTTTPSRRARKNWPAACCQNGCFFWLSFLLSSMRSWGTQLGSFAYSVYGNFTNSFICFFDTTCSTVIGIGDPFRIVESCVESMGGVGALSRSGVPKNAQDCRCVQRQAGPTGTILAQRQGIECRKPVSQHIRPATPPKAGSCPPRRETEGRPTAASATYSRIRRAAGRSP